MAPGQPHGEHPESEDILKQVERLLRSLPDDDRDITARVAEPFAEILADLQAAQEESTTPLQQVAEWFVDKHLPADVRTEGERRELTQRIEALIEAVLDSGLVDLDGDGLMLDEILLERPRVLGVEREDDWLDLRLADDRAAVVVGLHNCLDVQELVQALDETSQEAVSAANERTRRRPAVTAHAEAHGWAMGLDEDGMLELVFAETNEVENAQQRVRLILAREDARLLAAALRLSA